MLGRLTVVAAALAGATALLAVPAAANHAWGPYHWARTSNPFNLKLGDNVSGLWDNMLVTAKNDWDQSTVLNLSIVAGGTRPKPCKATSGRVEVCSASYGNSGYLGLAQIWITGGEHITQAIVKNNDYYFGSSSYQYNNTAEMQHVICQEIGHTFGLDHQSESGASLNTCMDYYHNTSATDTKSTHPNAGDYDELLCIYDPAYKNKTLTHSPHACTGTGHLDSFNSVGAVAAHGNATGNMQRVRDDLYVEDLGNGEKVFTWVFWANPRATHAPPFSG